MPRTLTTTWSTNKSLLLLAILRHFLCDLHIVKSHKLLYSNWGLAERIFRLAVIPSVLSPKRQLHIKLHLDLLPNKQNRLYPEAWDILVAFFLLSPQFSRTQTLKLVVILQYLPNTTYCNIFLSASPVIYLPYCGFQYYFLNLSLQNSFITLFITDWRELHAPF